MIQWLADFVKCNLDSPSCTDTNVLRMYPGCNGCIQDVTDVSRM